MMMPSLTLVCTAALMTAAVVRGQSWSTIPAIEVYGQHFFYTNNGSQFYIRGVGYQQNFTPNGTASSNVDYTDPLADGTACARDIPLMRQILTNVVRVYAIDPTKSHDDCMAQLASAGIYVIADLSAPSASINSDDPAWNLPLYTRYTSVVDALAKYNNVLGFFAGNEVVEKANQTAAAAFVKAAVRDTKNYIRQQGYRSSLGVGYATADVPTRDQLAHYFACQPSGSSSGNSTTIDYWGYNVYSWCGDSSYAASSYGERLDFFANYPVPVFFAEYGCIEGVVGGPTRRPFTEVAVLYGNMTSVFSGGIVYEWFMEQNSYGLVTVSGSSISAYPDFTSLSAQLAKVTPTITAKSAYTPSNSPPACPTSDASWQVVPTALPQPVNPLLCGCATSALQCTVGSTDATKYAAVFDYICGSDTSGALCAPIAHNATSGKYGAVAGCSPQQQLAYVANAYYLSHGSSASACDFSGLASTQGATTASSCSSVLNALGTAGTGSVGGQTGYVTPGQTAGGGGTAMTSRSSSAGAFAPARMPGGPPSASFFEWGRVLFSVYVVVAVVSGVGILVL